jgi:hypothetical protein
MKDFTPLPAAYYQPRRPQLWHHGSQVVRFWHFGHFLTGSIVLTIAPQGIHENPPASPFPDFLPVLATFNLLSSATNFY